MAVFDENNRSRRVWRLCRMAAEKRGEEKRKSETGSVILNFG
jgi:hypothetical protein